MHNKHLPKKEAIKRCGRAEYFSTTVIREQSTAMSVNIITPTLWFAGQALDAVKFYTSIFPNSRITHTATYPDAGIEKHGMQPGNVLAVSFELDGQRYAAINGPDMFKFNEAISLSVACKDQAEVDYYWDKLTEGADPAKQNCCWCADKFGLWWQIVPRVLHEIIGGDDPEKAKKAMEESMKWKKADVAALMKALGE